MGPEPNRCDCCSYTHPLKYKLWPHWRYQHTEAYKACDNCRNFRSLNLYSHWHFRHYPQRRCDDCGLRIGFFLKHWRDRHALAGFIETYDCDSCGKVCNIAANLHKHYVLTHGAKVATYCDECGKGHFSSSDPDAYSRYWFRHWLRFHRSRENSPSYCCDSCDLQIFDEKRKLVAHICCQHNRKIYQIPTCDDCCSEKVFLNKHNLAKHWQHQHLPHLSRKLVALRCDDCGHKALRQSHLFLHWQRRHAKGKLLRFLCDDCGTGILDAKNLWFHWLRLHSSHTNLGQKKTKILATCDVCGKASNDKSHFGRHWHAKHLFQGIKSQCGWKKSLARGTIATLFV